MPHSFAQPGAGRRSDVSPGFVDGLPPVAAAEQGGVDDEDVEPMQAHALAPSVGKGRGLVVGRVDPVDEGRAEHRQLREVGFGVPAVAGWVDEDADDVVPAVPRAARLFRDAKAFGGFFRGGEPFGRDFRRFARGPHDVSRPQVAVEEGRVRADGRGLRRVEFAVVQAFRQTFEDGRAFGADGSVSSGVGEVGQESVLRIELAEAAGEAGADEGERGCAHDAVARGAVGVDEAGGRLAEHPRTLGAEGVGGGEPAAEFLRRCGGGCDGGKPCRVEARGCCAEEPHGRCTAGSGGARQIGQAGCLCGCRLLARAFGEARIHNLATLLAPIEGRGLDPGNSIGGRRSMPTPPAKCHRRSVKRRRERTA